MRYELETAILVENIVWRKKKERKITQLFFFLFEKLSYPISCYRSLIFELYGPKLLCLLCLIRLKRWEKYRNFINSIREKFNFWNVDEHSPNDA